MVDQEGYNGGNGMHNADGAEVYVKMSDRGKNSRKNIKVSKKDGKKNMVRITNNTDSSAIIPKIIDPSDIENKNNKSKDDMMSTTGATPAVPAFDRFSEQEDMLRRTYVNVKRFCSPFPRCIFDNKL